MHAQLCDHVNIKKWMCEELYHTMLSLSHSENILVLDYSVYLKLLIDILIPNFV